MARLRHVGLVAFFLIVCCGGCAEGNGILTVDSGPPSERVFQSGRGIPAYRVHVDEKVRMSFSTRFAECDYAVVRDSAAGTLLDCGPAMNGRFEWTMLFNTEQAASGRRLITVSGYRQAGRRDTMPVGGELKERGDPSDEPDSRFAVASAFIDLYESMVEFEINAAEEKPDWSLSKLKIIREDGARTRLDCDPQKTPGLKLDGPDRHGSYRLSYHPKAEEVNYHGSTRAELIVADETGKTRTIEALFDTP